MLGRDVREERHGVRAFAAIATREMTVGCGTVGLTVSSPHEAAAVVRIRTSNITRAGPCDHSSSGSWAGRREDRGG